MRVLQLIDSLRPGGAERMALAYANALVPFVERSFICCTRIEGTLKEEISSDVGYYYLNKRNSIDIRAFFRFYKIIKENHIDIVHAHSSSYFMASVLKMLGVKFKLVWHDHYGESEFLQRRKTAFLKLFSNYFDAIFSVNSKLQEWAQYELQCNLVKVKSNFVIPETTINKDVTLKGGDVDFKIICVANLRPQKDHLNLIKAFEGLRSDRSISLHLIGTDFNNEYSKRLKSYIATSPCRKNIYVYGAQQNVSSLLQQAELGVLSSRSEGLPLALLEYGMAGLPAVVTDVGENKYVLKNMGRLVPPANTNALISAIEYYMLNEDIRTSDARNFKKHVTENYASDVVISEVIENYKYCMLNKN
ncbi:glycosyltransferase [Gillisia sp. M10.2A]|uniref:Glycosyltransferase n=1 Tax=Gillisia lutea TaxID=2909668 RepID=A0ABS9EGY9_9FLAO|nr:glycosyltransferase [Gillisia lutea]MCF4102137.1 glycosyltransferase [Gillisia lutea]